MNNKVKIKTVDEVAIMRQGGEKLARVKERLKKEIKVGVSASKIEDLATELIKKEGGEASFKKVPGYSWSVCININEGIVHGIPKKSLVFKKGDVVSVDMGMYFKGFHTDTSFTVGLDPSKNVAKFLEVGQSSLKKAIEKARVGNSIKDISVTIQKNIEGAGYTPIRALVGHGIGRDLHEYPPVPCFVTNESTDDIELVAGMVLAIEVMYTMGKKEVSTMDDGWTIRTKDGRISGLFEETVAISGKGPKILTT